MQETGQCEKTLGMTYDLVDKGPTIPSRQGCYLFYTHSKLLPMGPFIKGGGGPGFAEI